MVNNMHSYTHIGMHACMYKHTSWGSIHHAHARVRVRHARACMHAYVYIHANHAAGDGCFSMYGGTGITFNRVRCRDNHCGGWSGRKVPSSGSLMIYAGDENGVRTTGGALRGAVYWNACRPNHIIGSTHAGAWVEQDLKEADFELRKPVELSFCWHGE